MARRQRSRVLAVRLVDIRVLMRHLVHPPLPSPASNEAASKDATSDQKRPYETTRFRPKLFAR